jgi:hypothetical protein
MILEDQKTRRLDGQRVGGQESQKDGTREPGGPESQELDNEDARIARNETQKVSPSDPPDPPFLVGN